MIIFIGLNYGGKKFRLHAESTSVSKMKNEIFDRSDEIGKRLFYLK